MIDSHPSELMIRQRLLALSRTLPSARNGDPEGIHQARVATRRMREALPLVTRGSKGRKLKKKVSRLTRALGRVRELDVALINLDEMTADGTLHTEGIDLLRAVIKEERQRLYTDMAERIERIDFKK